MRSLGLSERLELAARLISEKLSLRKSLPSPQHSFPVLFSHRLRSQAAWKLKQAAAPDLNRCGLPCATALARSCGGQPAFPKPALFQADFTEHLKGWVTLSIARDRRADYLAAVSKPAPANDSKYLSAAGHTPVPCP